MSLPELTPPGIHMACVAVLVVAAWVHGFRWIGASERRRLRIELLVASWFRLPVRHAFSAFATVCYLAMALTAGVIFGLVGGAFGEPLRKPAPGWLPALVLGLVAAVNLTSLGMALLYALRPDIDVGSEVRSIGWIRGVYALPRVAAPVAVALSGFAEEWVFRGELLTGLVNTGWSFPAAAALSAGLFTYGQVVLTDTPLQRYVLALGSLAMAAVGSLLVGYTGSVTPAALVHAAFAAFYTESGVGRGIQTGLGEVRPQDGTRRRRGAAAYHLR